MPPDLLPLPDDPSDPVALADWLELVAIKAPDGNSSDGDLQSALAAWSDHDWDDEAAEALCDDVFEELSLRAAHAPGAYPFEVTPSVVERLPDYDPRGRTVYEFCLCLANQGLLAAPPGRQVSGPRLFELLCAEACHALLGGDACRLASPRQELPDHPLELPKPLREALDLLCSKLGEGGGAGPRIEDEKPQAKDAGVDVVAWRHFPDGNAAKLVVIGNCATGRNWRDSKLNDAQQRVFERYLQESLASQAVRALFTPRCVRVSRWDRNELADVAGLLMDRCRVAYCASQAKGFSPEPYRAWVDAVLSPASA